MSYNCDGVVSQDAWLWDLFAEHGSWVAAGGAAGMDCHCEEEEYKQWVDRLPPGSYAREKSLELRKLRHRGLQKTPTTEPSW